MYNENWEFALLASYSHTNHWLKGTFLKDFFLESCKTYPIVSITTNPAINEEGSIRVSVLSMLQQSANVEIV